MPRAVEQAQMATDVDIFSLTGTITRLCGAAESVSIKLDELDTKLAPFLTMPRITDESKRELQDTPQQSKYARDIETVIGMLHNMEQTMEQLVMKLDS